MTQQVLSAGTSGHFLSPHRSARSLLPMSVAAVIGMVISTVAAAQVTVKVEDFQKTESPWDMALACRSLPRAARYTGWT